MGKYVAACVYLMIFLLKLSPSFSATEADAEAEACIGATISLSFGFYLDTCPEAEPIVFSWVQKALSDDPRMAASLLRLHFHDCFVNASSLSLSLWSLSLSHVRACMPS